MRRLFEPFFRQALDAYHEGRNKSSGLSAAASGVGFDHHLEVMISERLLIEEQLLMRVSSGARARALTAARGNNLEVARQALDESLSVLYSDALSLQAKHILTSFHEAVEAYVSYKYGRYDEARRRVFKALETDGTLIREYGYKILELHRIQLGHNLMRIKGRECPLEAAKICLGLLRYIEGDEESWPISEFKNGGSPTELPADLLAAMFIQITGELALLLAGKEKGDGAAIFTPLVPLAEDRITLKDCQHRRARDWLYIKLVFLKRNTKAFLERVAKLLGEGPGEITLLWRAAATDLYQFCSDFSIPEAFSLKKEIGADARTWQRLPIQLKSIFDSPSKSRLELVSQVTAVQISSRA